MAASPGATRLDVALVRASLARSRHLAQEAIRAGTVSVDGVTVTKPAYPVQPTSHLERREAEEPWVSRGAYKLIAALAAWEPHGLHARGSRCIDIGASTGGFTQVLLHRGAAHVVAIDVGTGQLAGPVARDPRVTERSGTHVLSLGVEDVGVADVVVVDVSFISATTVLAHTAGWCASTGSFVVLVKPQFEVGPEGVGRGGIVRSATHRRAAVRAVLASAYASGLALRALMNSPLTGTHGNREYLLWLGPSRPGMMDAAAADLVAQGVDRKDDR